MLKRMGLFLATNIAVLVVISIVFQLLGIQGTLDAQGVGLDLGALLVMAAVIGFTGSFISLLMSKWSAKRATGAQIIAQPRNEHEAWLVDTVARQARDAGIGMPEVAIFDSPEPNAFATGWNRNNALVAVSTGLLRAMRRNEVEAVLAHEVSHVANGDMITMALIQGVVNTFVIFLSRLIGHIVDRAYSRLSLAMVRAITSFPSWPRSRSGFLPLSSSCGFPVGASFAPMPVAPSSAGAPI